MSTDPLVEEGDAHEIVVVREVRVVLDGAALRLRRRHQPPAAFRSEARRRGERRRAGRPARRSVQALGRDREHSVAVVADEIEKPPPRTMSLDVIRERAGIDAQCAQAVCAGRHPRRAEHGRDPVVRTDANVRARIGDDLHLAAEDRADQALPVTGLPAGSGPYRGDDSPSGSADETRAVHEGDRAGAEHVVVEGRAPPAATGVDEVAPVTVETARRSVGEPDVPRSRSEQL